MGVIQGRNTCMLINRPGYTKRQWIKGKKVLFCRICNILIAVPFKFWFKMQCSWLFVTVLVNRSNEKVIEWRLVNSIWIILDISTATTYSFKSVKINHDGDSHSKLGLPVVRLIQILAHQNSRTSCLGTICCL